MQKVNSKGNVPGIEDRGLLTVNCDKATFRK